MAGGGGIDKSTGNQRPSIWQTFNVHEKLGRDLPFEKQLPKLSSNFNQKERYGGSDIIKKSNFPTHLKCGWPLGATRVRWNFFFFGYYKVIGLSIYKQYICSAPLVI